MIQTSHLKAVTSRIKLGTCEIRRLNWVMITVSSITKNTGRYAMIHTEKKKNKVTKSMLQGDSNPHPPLSVRTKVSTSIHWTTSVNADSARLKEVYILL